MDLELVERVLDLPALVVEDAELSGGRVLGLEDRRQQPVALLGVAEPVIELVLDDTHLLTVALGALIGLVGVDARQIRAVGELLLAREDHVRLTRQSSCAPVWRAVWKRWKL